FSYRKIAMKDSIWKSISTRRHQAKTRSRKGQATTQLNLNPQQEQGLIQYSKDLTECHLPLKREMIQNFASAIAKEPVSEGW
ncbi:hypothetical protein P280DRAFT_367438, partial [Massarina eburnea CBS 473.64]